MDRGPMRVLLAPLGNVQVPVAVDSVSAVLMCVGVRVDVSAEGQPPADETQRNQHASANDFPGVLES